MNNVNIIKQLTKGNYKKIGFGKKKRNIKYSSTGANLFVPTFCILESISIVEGYKAIRLLFKTKDNYTFRIMILHCKKVLFPEGHIFTKYEIGKPLAILKPNKIFFARSEWYSKGKAVQYDDPENVFIPNEASSDYAYKPKKEIEYPEPKEPKIKPDDNEDDEITNKEMKPERQQKDEPKPKPKDKEDEKHVSTDNTRKHHEKKSVDLHIKDDTTNDIWIYVVIGIISIIAIWLLVDIVRKKRK